MSGDSGVGGSVVTNSVAQGSDSVSGNLPYQRTFSPQFHQFVQLCLQANPQSRLVLYDITTCSTIQILLCISKLVIYKGVAVHNKFYCFLDPNRPTAAGLLQHAFFKQVRRKSAVESLPDLLQPVSPLTNVNLTEGKEHLP